MEKQQAPPEIIRRIILPRTTPPQRNEVQSRSRDLKNTFYGSQLETKCLNIPVSKIAGNGCHKSRNKPLTQTMRTKVAKPMQVIRAWLPNMSLETCVIGYKRRPKKGHESS